MSEGKFPNIAAGVSSILAGFKLATIVVSIFGIGSIAKWVIEEWYPFTRWVWDVLSENFNFPHFDDLTKDSLTALVFFMPLGISAVVKGYFGAKEDYTLAIRILSFFLSLIFLYLICKDVILFTLDATSIKNKSEFEILKLYRAMIALIITVLAFFTLKLVAKKIISEKIQNKFKDLMEKTIQNRWTLIILFSFQITFVLFTLYQTAEKNGKSDQIIIPSGVLIAILICIYFANTFNPKQLFSATGAALSFIFASALFEAVIFLKGFIDSAPT